VTLRAEAKPPSDAQAGAQRIDKWLWIARFLKTRTLAGKFAASGAVRLTRDGDTGRIEKASALVRVGDRLTFMTGERLRVIEVNALGARRGPAAEAKLLYTDYSPPPEARAPAASAARDKGAGRPTKKERRAIDRMRPMDSN
jgi:ribosome-associated heat shock protein Hsp15